MSLIRQIARGLAALTHRAAAEQDAADEVRHYLEQSVTAHVARGVPEEEARRLARREVGGLTNATEQVTAYGWENAVSSLLSDGRYAVRRLRSQPGFTVVTAVTLAVGIGATTAIFSAVNPILFQSLPYPDANRVVMIWDYGVEGAELEPTFGTYRELAERAHSFSALAVMRSWQPTLTGAAEPERLEGQAVTPDYFRALGVPPILGRGFEAAEDQVGGPRAAVLSDALWRRRFNADPSIIGRPITLDGDPFTVVGIMPRGFSNVLASDAELWTTLRYDMSQGRAWGHHLRMVARLRPGVRPDDAERELGSIADSPVAEFPRVPWADLSNGLRVTSLQTDLTRGVRPALLAILGAVLLVLVIAVVNVTNLLLARGVERRAEFALRTALGAGQGRLMRQLLTESLVLAALGGALGVAVAWLGVQALVRLSPPGLPRVDAIAMDPAALVFAFAITTVVGLVFGFTPALQAARNDPQADLQHSSTRTVGRHRRTRNVLVVLEVGLALVLLVGSGLLLRSLTHLFAIEPGFEPAQLLTMQVQTSGHQFDEAGARYRFFARALEAVQAVPGVTAAGFTSQLPLSGDLAVYGLHFEPSLSTDPGEDRGTYRYAVSAGYLEAMRIPLRQGRLLEERDRADGPPVALISESVARRRLPGLDPIGRQIVVGDGPPATVVGVVGDVRQQSLALDYGEAVYLPASQPAFLESAMSLVVRTRGDAAALAAPVRRAVWSVDRDQPVVRVGTMDDLVAASGAERRFALVLFEAFGLASLVLAAAGIYGVLSGSVAERTREIGVRSALGASRAEILSLIMRQGLSLALLGVVLGALAATAATRAINGLLFGVSRLDPLTYAGVVVLLMGVAAVACCVPAWRAARVEPSITLRGE